MLAWLELSVKQGKPADALREPAMNYLVRTKPIIDGLSEAEKTSWHEVEARTASLGAPTSPPAQEEKP
jgi:hypothetical protein